MSGEQPSGATPLDPDELDGLIPAGIFTRDELNAWEQVGVREARMWALARRRPLAQVLSPRFLDELHRRMFRSTWRWAGSYRRSDKNIGVHWPTIPGALNESRDDVQLWIDAKTWSIEEIAARFHHRLVVIHPFPNGNGRWSRLATDVVMTSIGQPRPNWGRTASSEPRADYLRALRRADRGAFDALVEFLWS